MKAKLLAIITSLVLLVSYSCKKKCESFVNLHLSEQEKKFLYYNKGDTDMFITNYNDTVSFIFTDMSDISGPSTSNYSHYVICKDIEEKKVKFLVKKDDEQIGTGYFSIYKDIICQECTPHLLFVSKINMNYNGKDFEFTSYMSITIEFYNSYNIDSIDFQNVYKFFYKSSSYTGITNTLYFSPDYGIIKMEEVIEKDSLPPDTIILKSIRLFNDSETTYYEKHNDFSNFNFANIRIKALF